MHLDALAHGLNGTMGRLYPGPDQPGQPKRVRKQLRRKLAAAEQEARALDSAWALAAELVTETLTQLVAAPLPAGVVERFNELAAEVPLVVVAGGPEINPRLPKQLRLPDDRQPYHVKIFDRALGGRRSVVARTWLVARDSRGHVVAALRDFFSAPERDRLKRCPQCARWFVDLSKNKAKARCSVSCTAKWWSRARRKEAGHSQYAPRKRQNDRSPQQSRVRQRRRER